MQIFMFIIFIVVSAKCKIFIFCFLMILLRILLFPQLLFSHIRDLLSIVPSEMMDQGFALSSSLYSWKTIMSVHVFLNLPWLGLSTVFLVFPYVFSFCLF